MDSKRIINRSDLFLKSRSIRNLFCMGHCAPAIMNTLLEVTGVPNDKLVKQAAANPGGIGLLGSECGAVTSPVMALGLEYGKAGDQSSLSTVIELGQQYIKAFSNRNGSIHCREIQKNGPEPIPCIKAVASALPLIKCVIRDQGQVRRDNQGQTANQILLQSLRSEPFHCAHAVLRRLEDTVNVDGETLRASLGFVGGTVLLGHTCGTLVAGVMAIGLAEGEIENSYFQLPKMMGTMALGGSGLAPHVNKFNRAIGMGRELVSWFEQEFEFTDCKKLTGADFSDASSVQKFIDEQRIVRCRAMSEAVAQKVSDLIH